MVAGAQPGPRARRIATGLLFVLWTAAAGAQSPPAGVYDLAAVLEVAAGAGGLGQVRLLDGEWRREGAGWAGEGVLILSRSGKRLSVPVALRASEEGNGARLLIAAKSDHRDPPLRLSLTGDMDRTAFGLELRIPEPFAVPGAALRLEGTAGLPVDGGVQLDASLRVPALQVAGEHPLRTTAFSARLRLVCARLHGHSCLIGSTRLAIDPVEIETAKGGLALAGLEAASTSEERNGRVTANGRLEMRLARLRTAEGEVLRDVVLALEHRGEAGPRTWRALTEVSNALLNGGRAGRGPVNRLLQALGAEPFTLTLHGRLARGFEVAEIGVDLSAPGGRRLDGATTVGGLLAATEGRLTLDYPLSLLNDPAFTRVAALPLAAGIARVHGRRIEGALTWKDGTAVYGDRHVPLRELLPDLFALPVLALAE